MLEYPKSLIEDENVSELKALLTDCPAAVDLSDERGQTLLHYACAQRFFNAIWVLVVAGASTEIKDNNGARPIDLVKDYKDAAEVTLIFSTAKEIRMKNIHKELRD